MMRVRDTCRKWIPNSPHQSCGTRLSIVMYQCDRTSVLSAGGFFCVCPDLSVCLRMCDGFIYPWKVYFSVFPIRVPCEIYFLLNSGVYQFTVPSIIHRNWEDY